MLNTESFSYAFGVNKSGYLTHLHWGGKLSRIDDLPSIDDLLCYRHCPPKRGSVARQEYPGFGGEFYSEPSLKVDFPDGVRCSLLKYERHTTQIDDTSEELVVTLKDSDYPLFAELHYRVYSDSDVMERWSIIRNEGSGCVTINNALSANFNLPDIHNEYRLSHLTGRWGREHKIERQQVNQSKITLESRTGLSGPFASPFFALDDGAATEHAGRVWFGALQWSGNWKIVVEKDGYDRVSVCGGINDFDFSWPLSKNEEFVTPVFCVGISDEGFGGASRILHRYQRSHLMPKEILQKPMPLLFNSWSSMGIDVDEKKIIDVAQKAAEIGTELFVIDDGWQCALGDWMPDPVKFPNGLRPVIDKVRNLGMDFGLWVEIESFEIKSDLYQKHPEWAMSFDGREIDLHYRGDVDRTSMLLNFARTEVAKYMYQALRKLILETGIKYLKLDMNYYFTTPGWNDAQPATRQTVWVKYVRNLYSVFEKLHAEFPDMIFENCAAGASRADYGMSRYFSRINRSDNQDTLDILRMHEGFAWQHLSRTAGGGCHISDAVYGINLRNIPMKFQAYVGMMGSLSVGKNLTKCNEDELSEIATYAKMYKRFRHITQNGELYRVASHYEHPYAAFQFISPDQDEALLCVYGHSIQFADKIPPFILHGLNPDKIYELEYFGNNPQPNYTASKTDYPPISGQGLMSVGLHVELLGDYDSRIIYLKAK